MTVEIGTVFSASLVKMSERVWSELVDDLRQDLRDQFGFGVTGDGECVGSQRSLEKDKC